MSIFKLRDKVFLNVMNIHITYFSTKLSHYCSSSYIVEKRVKSILYCLKLLLVMIKDL